MSWVRCSFTSESCAIFLGHLAGLLTPIAVWEAFGVSHGAKQMLAIVVGGAAGLLCLAGGLLLLHRRLFDARIRSTSSFGDTAILLLLLMQLGLGLATIPFSLEHRDGSEMVKYMLWAQGIFTFREGAANYVADAHWIFKAHLVIGLDDPAGVSVHAARPHAFCADLVSQSARVADRALETPCGGGAPAMKHTLIRTPFGAQRTEAPFSGCSLAPAPSARRGERAAPVVVNGIEIAEAMIAQEAQNHPATNAAEARAAAACALAVRELLLQRARSLGLSPVPLVDAGGREEAPEEALVRMLLEKEVEATAPSDDECGASTTDALAGSFHLSTPLCRRYARR